MMSGCEGIGKLKTTVLMSSLAKRASRLPDEEPPVSQYTWISEEEGKERSTAAFWAEEAEEWERDQTAFKLNSGTSLSAGRCCECALMRIS